MLLGLASHDTHDAIRVLEERSLHTDALAKLKEAYAKELEAIGENSRPRRDDLIEEILALKAEARAAMVTE